jgi:class 3 adenylate cyclase
MVAEHPTLQTTLFADISGSTRLYERLGDTRALALVTSCMKKLQEIAQRHSGVMVKTIGDEIMCLFELPERAATAAIAMQEAICVDPAMMAYDIRLRIGFHHGATIKEGSDYYGDAVNLAARLAALAKAAQIITDKFTLNLLDTDRRRSARLVDETRVKGKGGVFELYEIPWGRPEEQTIIGIDTGEAVTPPDAKASLKLNCQGKIYTVDDRQPSITIGRDSGNGIVINSPLVSRAHARIELRRDKFILVDQSINGTYLCSDGAAMVTLRRDETVMPRRGFIAVGQPVPADATEAVQFQIR